MTMRYYLSQTPDRRVIRGDVDNWLDFAFFNTENGEWDYSLNTFYSDEILVSSISDYREISEREAQAMLPVEALQHA